MTTPEPGRGRPAVGALRALGFLAAGILVVVVLLLLANGTTGPVDVDAGTEARTQAGADATPLACEVVVAGAPLPVEVHETSGVARGSRSPDLFWTHNDSGGDPELFAIGADGTLAGRVGVTGAAAADWEDIASAPCADGSGPCLYIADTGDNDAERDRITVYAVPEPAPGQATVAATPIHARFPDGPRDAEGLFVVDGRLHLVTKGREGPIRLFRFPRAVEAGRAAASGATVLEPVAELAPRPTTTADYVTAAAASPDGRWVAVRTYRALMLFEAAPLLAGNPGPTYRFDLTRLAEAQGEGVAVSADGDVWLTSEARGDAPPTWSRLSCMLPGASDAPETGASEAGTSEAGATSSGPGTAPR